MHPVSEQDNHWFGDIGDNIRERRNACGMSQTDLALDTGSDKGRISIIENGATDPKVSSLIIIAKALDTDIHELTKPKEEKKQEEPLSPKIMARIAKVPPEKKDSLEAAISQILNMIDC